MKCKMNSISVNLHSYYSKFINLHNYIFTNVNHFKQTCVNFTNLSIINSLMLVL